MTESLVSEPVISESDRDASLPGVSVQIADLLTGTKLRHPLLNSAGVLLVAEGTTITSQLKQRIASYGKDNVRINPDDLGNVTLDVSDIEGRQTVGTTSELIERLDSIIDQGVLLVKNDGPAMQGQMVSNGRKPFDASRREELLTQHQATRESLDSMMREVGHGQELNGKQIAQLVATYLTDMAEDNEHVLSIAMSADKQGLSERALQTSLMAMTIGVEMGFDVSNVRLLGICGLVHDWGMTRVPEEILSKSGRLTEIEFLEIQKHPIHTLDILTLISGIPGIVPLVVYQVHESLNGTGYPRGRKGSSIHPFARILHVVDVYTALTSPRSYRNPIMPYGAVECLLQLASKRVLDSKVITALLNAFSLFPIGSFVTLDDASVAQVLRPNRGKFDRPIVQLVRDSQGQKVPVSDDSIIDLATSERQVVQAIPTPGRNEIPYSKDVLTGSACHQYRDQA
ncbi:HD-GYP domain-containing protein [Thalassoroseus pseudoceratinae]|uniref:HD-GYP domain-containing protein n=1 Tax=Thalassoroseus pseudoceratinae TaxID=2713176 RepID=UPI001421A246|nr:HD domain-containing phosphohydrolase [Thalassoroseus pseudoceratinae]